MLLQEDLLSFDVGLKQCIQGDGEYTPIPREYFVLQFIEGNEFGSETIFDLMVVRGFAM